MTTIQKVTPVQVTLKAKNRIDGGDYSLGDLHVGDTFLFNDGKGAKPARVIHKTFDYLGRVDLVVYQYIGYVCFWAVGQKHKAFRDSMQFPANTPMGVKLSDGRSPDTLVTLVDEINIKVKHDADADVVAS